MDTNFIYQQIQQKKSFLCLGLDPDLNKIPEFLIESSKEPLLDFCKSMVDNINPFCIAVKINTAFFEAYGSEGYKSLELLVKYIKAIYPELFVIADAKRGDIGNSSNRYAKAFFDSLPFDAITISPYLGTDSIEPFLEYENKYAIVLALTSNKGSEDFQLPNDGKLFKSVLKTCNALHNSDKIMYVVGATHPEQLKEIRNIVPNSFILVPGVGAQGGILSEVYSSGANNKVGLLVNSSRGIIYASQGKDCFEAAKIEAKLIQNEMENLLKK